MRLEGQFLATEKRPLRKIKKMFLQQRERLLTSGSIARYTASMPIQFILPKKFTRAQIEWRVDELALQFQGTRDKKLLAQIAGLNRLLARMDERDSNRSDPKNRQ